MPLFLNHTKSEVTYLTLCHTQVSVADLSSLHGTYIRGEKLKPNVPFIIESGDTIVLGKEIYRDSKVGICAIFALHPSQHVVIR